MVDNMNNQESNDERIQTGVRLKKNTVKVLKGLAEYYDIALGDLLELIIMESLEGTTPFTDEDTKVINKLISIYGLKDEEEEGNIDTIVVPAYEDGFKDVFLKENRWYSVSIADERLDKIKYIAVYRTQPTSAITHYAEVERIERWQKTNKYVITFKGEAKPIKPIKLSDRKEIIRSRKYTSISKLLKAKTLTDVF